MLPRGILTTAAGLLLLAASCDKPPPPRARAEIIDSGPTFHVVPAEGQLPFCLVIENRGGVRPLIAGEEGQSVPCNARQPIGGQALPRAAGEAHRIYVVFSDRPLRADTVSQQIKDRLDEGPSAAVTSMDLRAPGQCALEAIDVRP